MAAINALLSSVLLAAALPNEMVPYGIGPLGAFALVPVLLATYRSDSWRSAARIGALFGAVSTAVANYWLAFFGEFSVWTIGGTVLGYTAYNYLLFGFIFHLSRSSRYRAIRIATLWAGYEYLKSIGFLAYPWGLIAYPGSNSPLLMQTAELTGVWGLSWIMAYINASIAEFVVTMPRRRSVTEPADLLAACSIVVVLYGFGAFRLNEELPVRDSVNVALIQQNVNSWEPGKFEDALLQAQNLTYDALSASPQPDLVVWSETALRRPFIENSAYYRDFPAKFPFLDFMASAGVPIVSGTPIRVSETSNDYMNGAVLILNDGSVAGRYGKQQLVPFAESIPFYEHQVVKDFFRNVIGVYGSWVPGRETTVFDVPGKELAFATPICFEDAFGFITRDMARAGADFFVNLTNNSWSRQYSAQTQHFAAARLRAVETRRPLVRGTNSGLTAVVDDRGRLIAAAPMFRSTSLIATVSVPEPVTTLYMRIGDLFGRVFVIVSLGASFLACKKNRDRYSIGPA